MHIINNLAKFPGVCIGLSVLFFLVGLLMIYGLLDALLKMHRSKSSVKEIKKEYNFFQNIWLTLFETNCLHAVEFCKGLVWFWRIRCLIFVLYLLLGLASTFGLSANTVIAWLTAGMFIFLDIPLLIIHCFLSRPFIGRFREYSFEKYHNTRDHKSLF